MRRGVAVACVLVLGSMAWAGAEGASGAKSGGKSAAASSGGVSLIYFTMAADPTTWDFYTYVPGMGTLTRIAKNFPARYWLETSPDGILYAARGSDLYAVNPEDGTAQIVANFHAGGTNVVCYGFTFAPDGTLYFHERDNTQLPPTHRLHRASRSTGELTLIGEITGLAADLNGIEWAGDALYGIGPDGLWRLDAATAAATPVGSAPGHYWDLDYGPDGVLRVVALNEWDIYAFDTATGAATYLTRMMRQPWGIATPLPPDTTAPAVLEVSTSLADGKYGVGRAVPIEVRFSEDVTYSPGTGGLTLALATGTPPGLATYSGGSGTSVLAFSYTVQPGDDSPDLDYVSSAALALSGTATLRDSAGNDAVLTLPPPGSPVSLGGGRAIAVDARGPTVTVTAQSTDNLTPSLWGTLHDSSAVVSVTVRVNGWTYAATAVPDAWIVDRTALLLPGVYDVAVEAVDELGNVGTDATEAELRIGEGLWVDFAWRGAETGSRTDPYNTLREAVEASVPGGLVRIKGDSAAPVSSETLRITKRLRIQAVGGPVRIGAPGGAGGSGMLFAAAEPGSDTPVDAGTGGLQTNAWGSELAKALHGLADAAQKPEPSVEPPLYAPALPAMDAVHTGQSLALRLRDEEAIDPATLRVRVSPNAAPGARAAYREAVPGNAADLWVVLAPAQAWPEGERIAWTAEALTITGRTVGPVGRAAWVQADEPSAEPAEEAAIRNPAPDEDVPPAPGNATCYRIGPEAAFTEPQRLWLPVGTGSDPAEIRLYYYVGPGTAFEPGWYPAGHVEGFMVPGTLRAETAPEGTRIRFDVRHGGLVAVGKR